MMLSACSGRLRFNTSIILEIVAKDEALEYIEQWAEDVINQASIELKAKHPKKTYRALGGWVGKGRGAKPRGVQVRTKRYSSETTGKLRESLDYKVTKSKNGTYRLQIQAEDYWYYVNFGRRKGKFAPPSVIQAWVQAKPIRPQKGGGKGFAKRKRGDYKTLAFLINRKIMYFGIEGTKFLTKTVEINEPDLAANLGEKLAKEIADTIRVNWGKGLKNMKIERDGI